MRQIVFAWGMAMIVGAFLQQAPIEAEGFKMRPFIQLSSVKANQPVTKPNKAVDAQKRPGKVMLC